MLEGTKEDWDIIAEHSKGFNKGLAKRVLDHLRLLDGDYGGFPVDRLTHSLQTATRAHRDGRDEEYVVCALLHDIGDTLGSYNHPDVAAAILKPFVSKTIHTLNIRPNSATSMISRPLTPSMNASRWTFLNPWSNDFSPVRRIPCT